MTLGTEMETRKLNGRIYVEIDDKALVRAGDVVDYERNGVRTRRVESAHIGRVHKYVTVEALVAGHCLIERGHRVPLADVRRVWRRRTEARSCTK